MLSIVSVAYPFAPVLPDSVGGAEQIVAELDRALSAAGQRSTLVACRGSSAAQRLVPAGADAVRIDEAARARAASAVRRTLASLLASVRADVVHLHGIDFLDYLPEGETPVLATLHLPLSWYPAHVLEPGAPFRGVCVSASQRASARGAASFSLIENGVCLERFQPRADKADFALVMGRICPEKGFDLALQAAHRAGVELIVAGQVFPYEDHERYFADSVAPLLDPLRRFVGPVAGAAKRELLARARCLLIPSVVAETSSLVAMEALASGTPVIAFPQGALPEIVEHGRTGFLVDGAEQMAEAIATVSELRSSECRARAEARFSAARMARAYFEVYAELAASARSSSVRPSSQGPALDVEIVEDERRLSELAPAWSALCDADVRASPFQRPEWQLAWNRHLGSGQPYTLAAWKGERLVGLLPLRREGSALSLAGSGVSDYLDLVSAPELEQCVAATLLEHLSGSSHQWETLSFDALRPGSALLGARLPRNIEGEVAAREPSPVAPVPAAAAPAKLAYYFRHVQRAGAVCFRWAESAAEARSMLHALFTLHAARWARRGEPGVLADERVQWLHLECAAAFSERGIARLLSLEIGGTTAAVWYGFSHHGRFLMYLGGFDPALARYSPGALLIAKAFERAAAEGAAEFDFLRGRERYKYQWGAVDRSAWQRRIRRVSDSRAGRS